MHGDPGREPTQEDIERGYEGGDIRMRGLMIFLVVFVGSLIVINVVVYGVRQYIARSTMGLEDATQPENPLKAVNKDAASPPTPAPRLEPSPDNENLPYVDLRDLRADEYRKLNGAPTYQDKKAGVLRFPITDAIDQVAANGLPEKLPPLGPTDAPALNYDGTRAVVTAPQR